MAVAVDQPDALPALPVLLHLAAQHAVHGLQLPVQGHLPQLFLLHREQQHAGQVHQGAGVEHIEGGLVLLGEGQVAHRKGGQGHHRGAGQRPAGDLRPGPGGGRRAAELLPGHKPEHTPVHQQQQQQRQRMPAAPGRPEHAVELPFQAGGQLGQQKGPGTAVAGLPGGDVAAEKEIQVHGGHRGHHAGNPPAQRQPAVSCKNTPCHTSQNTASAPVPARPNRRGRTARDDRAGQPLGQGGVQPGDIRQCGHLAPPPM